MQIRNDGTKYRTADGCYRVKRILATDVAGNCPVVVELEAATSGILGPRVQAYRADGTSIRAPHLNLVAGKRRYEGWILMVKSRSVPHGCLAFSTWPTREEAENAAGIYPNPSGGVSDVIAILPFSFEEGEGLEG